MFVFSGFRLDVDFGGAGGEFNEELARGKLLSMASEIWIDKTYVNFEGTKYKSAFLKEEGWNELLRFVWKAKRGRGGIAAKAILRQAFEQMIEGYMEHVAGLLGYDESKIQFTVDPDSEIKVWLVKDTAAEWLTYPGPWQDWPENN